MLHESRIEEDGEIDTLDSCRTVEAVVPGVFDNDANGDFFVDSKAEERVICGDFDVAIFMTESSEPNRGYRWMSTQMYGSLRLTTQGGINGIPCALINVIERGSAGSEFESLFQYEIPMNFKHDCDLSRNFYAIEGLKGNYFGFQFAKPAQKEVFMEHMIKL